MKKLLPLIVIISTLMLFSCSSSSDSSQSSSDVLLKKTIWDDGTIINFEYIGNKISRYSSSDGSYTTFTYTGDLITREEYYSSNNTINEYYEYYYSGNNLIQIKNFIGTTLNRKFDLVINNDNTITRTRTNYSGTSTSRTVFKEYFLNEEKIKEEQFNSSGSIVNTTTFLRDNKNCPTMNITGFRYLNGWYSDDSPFHNIIRISESSFTSNNQNYSYQYNSNNYPTIGTCTAGGYTESTQYFY
jgi:hypothetical protein